MSKKAFFEKYIDGKKVSFEVIGVHGLLSNDVSYRVRFPNDKNHKTIRMKIRDGRWSIINRSDFNRSVLELELYFERAIEENED